MVMLALSNTTNAILKCNMLNNTAVLKKQYTAQYTVFKLAFASQHIASMRKDSFTIDTANERPLDMFQLPRPPLKQHS